jgi:hypothetical protein
MPPTQDTTRAPVLAYSQVSSRLTCRASSRVGAMISASGAPYSPKRSASPSSVGAMAMPKATVLPEPVWADTSRSRPWASPSRIAACTGVGAA